MLPRGSLACSPSPSALQPRLGPYVSVRVVHISWCPASQLCSYCPVIHIGTFIATLVVTSRAGKRGGGTLLLLAVALWVLAFANEACTLGFYQTAVTHGDKTTETAYQFLADNQAGSWNVGILVTGFLTALLADGYLVRLFVRFGATLAHINFF